LSFGAAVFLRLTLAGITKGKSAAVLTSSIFG
jgi:hypothetical protein